MDKGAIGYYPEMGHEKPNCQIEARFVLGKWCLKTPLTLKGRGIKHMQTYKASDLVPQAQHKVGWNSYEVTQLAFKKLKEQHSIVVEILLD